MPTSVGGNPQGLNRTMRELGIHSDSWVLNNNKFAYKSDNIIFNDNDSKFICELKRLFALIYVFKYNIIFFNFGKSLFSPTPYYHLRNSKGYFLNYYARVVMFYYHSLMQNFEILLLKILRRKVFIQYQGDDARQGYYISKYPINLTTEVDYYTKRTDIFKSNQISKFSKLCTQIYSLNPDLLHVLPPNAKFLPYSHVCLKQFTPVYTCKSSKLLKIGHAPSSRKVKGTSYILEALNKLKHEGFAFELILVEGLSNKKALKIYESIDILVDQLFVGWYGGLAVECMALGKPVICYIRDEDLIHLPEDMRSSLPIIGANPYNIYDILKNVLNSDRNELYDMARKSRNFVEEWHNPVKVARRLLNDIKKHK